ncbi:MAG: WxcM-like domain-containing protein [bacterium]|nr:WxcM-like domain-containing protein [bacterium]
MKRIKTKKLLKIKDDRGWLAEILKSRDVDGKHFGQLIVTTALPGKIKGNHYHLRKREWYCVIKGSGLLTITDRKSGETKTLKMSDEEFLLVEIPKNYLHSIKNIGTDMMYLIAYTDEPFNPTDEDTYYVESKR